MEGGSKRDRQRANRQARLEAEAAAARREKRWRQARIAGLALVVVVALVVIAVLRGDDDDETDVSTNGSTTTVAPAEGSAAGKPCVPAKDVPEGAPEVPVEEGPPPEELVTEDLKVGDGETVLAGATVTAHYVGVSCSTGKVFDSSYERGEPAPFSLGQVIKGWQDGIPGMKVGGRRLLGIPPDQAYGAQGRPPDIGPDETLWFVVEVVAVEAG